jgi:hypothetical protein
MNLESDHGCILPRTLCGWVISQTCDPAALDCSRSRSPYAWSSQEVALKFARRYRRRNYVTVDHLETVDADFLA